MMRTFQKINLESAYLIASWPNPLGVWNVGLFTADFFRWALGAKDYGRVEVETGKGEYNFYKVTIQGLMKYIGPLNSFYFKALPSHDIIIFLGDNRVGDLEAENIVKTILDIAQENSCRRIYLLQSVISITHHRIPPRVVAITNGGNKTKAELERNGVIILPYRNGREFITGFNKILMTRAYRRNIEYVCLITEVPFYAPESALYPQASVSLIEVLRRELDVYPDLTLLAPYIEAGKNNVESIYAELPEKEILEGLWRKIVKLRLSRNPIILHTTPTERKILADSVREILKEGAKKKGRKKDDGDDHLTFLFD